MAGIAKHSVHLTALKGTSEGHQPSILSSSYSSYYMATLVSYSGYQVVLKGGGSTGLSRNLYPALRRALIVNEESVQELRG